MKSVAISLAALLIPMTEAVIQDCTITLYDNEYLDDATPPSVTLTVGNYELADIVALGTGLGDDSVSSLKVRGTRCVATLYNYNSFSTSSWSANFPEGDYPLARLRSYGGYNNQMTSVRVWRAGCSVTIFNGDNLQTDQLYMSLLTGVYTLADLTSLHSGFTNNMVSSIRVAGPRCSATLYDGTKFETGPDHWSVMLAEGDYPVADLSARGVADNEMSSIKVLYEPCVATIYDGPALEDGLWHMSLTVGEYTLTNLTDFGSGTAGDVVSSMRVSGYGCSATVYQSDALDDGSGWSATFSEGDYPSAQYTAGGAVDNQLNSIQVSYTPGAYVFPGRVFSGTTGTAAITSFFPASIGEQWAYSSGGLTLAAGDAVHKPAILRSVMFELPPSTSIHVESPSGGTGRVTRTSVAEQGAVVEYVGNTDSSGFLGVAINDYARNTWIVSKHRSSSTGNETLVFSTTDLAPFAGREVTLDVVDAYSGSDGAISVSGVTVSIACAAMTTTDSCQFDVHLCAAVAPGEACEVRCSSPYYGTQSHADCPADNTLSSTLLTIYPGMPLCKLPCKNPDPMPVGYAGEEGADNVTCAVGYEGTAVKTCTVDSATCTEQMSMSGCHLPGMATVAGDPITYYGSVRKEFKVPPGDELTPLLTVPDMHVLASAVKGNGDEQWLNRIVVTTPAGQEVVSVTIKSDLFGFNRTALPPNAFETLGVRMEWWFPQPLAVMPPANEYFIHWHGLRVAFGRARGAAPGAPRREMVMVVGRFVNAYITSSSASEYYDELEDAYKYAHLDLIVGDMRNRSLFGGLLPELWGIGLRRPDQHGGAEHSRNMLLQ